MKNLKNEVAMPKNYCLVGQVVVDLGRKGCTLTRYSAVVKAVL